MRTRGGGCDHDAVVAEIGDAPEAGFRWAPKPRGREVVDRETWEGESGAWQARVEARLVQESTEGDVMVKLDGAVDIAWQEMPKRYVSGKAGRLPRDLVRLEANQRLLNKALDEWERAEDSENGGFWRRREAVQRGLIPELVWAWPPSPDRYEEWKGHFQAAAKAHERLVKERWREHNKGRIKRYRSQCRERMQQPKSGEIQRLMGKRTDAVGGGFEPVDWGCEWRETHLLFLWKLRGVSRGIG